MKKESKKDKLSIIIIIIVLLFALLLNLSLFLRDKPEIIKNFNGAESTLYSLISIPPTTPTTPVVPPISPPTCTPQCQNKQCGPDGCGGYCGSCPTGATITCDDNGKCVDVQVLYNTMNPVPVPDTLPPTCSPQCQNKQCGSDGCSGLCGTCVTPKICSNSQCVNPPSCTPMTCQSASMTCGILYTCGTQINCGTCQPSGSVVSPPAEGEGNSFDMSTTIATEYAYFPKSTKILLTDPPQNPNEEGLPINNYLKNKVNNGLNKINNPNTEEFDGYIISFDLPYLSKTTTQAEIKKIKEDKDKIKKQVLDKLGKNNADDESGFMNSILIKDKLTDNQINDLKKITGVKGLYKNYITTVNMYDTIDLTQIEEVHKLNAQMQNCLETSTDCLTGKGIKIAIIDTGIDYTHECLGKQARLSPGQVFPSNGKVIDGWDFINNDNDPFDDNGHGTFVAQLAAGSDCKFKGMAPDAKIYAYKSANNLGQVSVYTVGKAIERAMDPNKDGVYTDKADVISLSIGFICTSYNSQCGPDDALSTYIDMLSESFGTVFVIAAGNNNPNDFGKPGTITSPGTSRNAITVGSVNKFDTISPFSARGPVVLSTGETVYKPDVVTNGENVCSALASGQTLPVDSQCYSNNFKLGSGTSFSTPHVSGLVAIMKQLHPDWNSFEIKQAILLSSIDLGQDFSAQGFGMMNALEAVKQPRPTLPYSRIINRANNDVTGKLTFSVEKKVNLNKCDLADINRNEKIDENDFDEFQQHLTKNCNNPTPIIALWVINKLNIPGLNRDCTIANRYIEFNDHDHKKNNGKYYLSPLDALKVINILNSRTWDKCIARPAPIPSRADIMPNPNKNGYINLDDKTAFNTALDKYPYGSSCIIWEPVNTPLDTTITIKAVSTLKLDTGYDNKGNRIFAGFNNINYVINNPGDYRIKVKFVSGTNTIENLWNFKVI